MRRLLGNLAAMALATAVALAIGEALLRPFVTLPLPRTLPEVRYDAHPVRRFTLRPSQRAFTYGAPVAIDARGFREGGAPVPDAAPRLLALGDSFTFGMGVTDEETWPARVQRELSARGRDVAVVNAGTISYGVFQQADLLRERGLAIRPVTVIHGLYWNDFMNAAAPSPGEASPVTPNGYFVWDRLEAQTDGLTGRARALASRSALLFSVRQAVSNVTADRAGTSAYGRAFERFVREGLTPDEWQPLEQFYRDLVSLGTTQGFGVLVVVMPISDLSARPGAAPHPYAVQAGERLRALGVPAVDALTLLRQDADAARYFLPQGADAHLNADGYARIAPAIAAALADDPRLTAPAARPVP